VRALFAIALLAAASAYAACGGGDDEEAEPTATLAVPTESVRVNAQQVEADNDPSLPGEYVDIPGIYEATYGGEPNTAPHVRDFVDYTTQGLPPAGGPHWGAVPCGDIPSSAPFLCGPAPWGIYREAWAPETLVHNMEHAGVIVWYNTADQDVIDQVEEFALEQLQDDVQLVMAPYPDMDDETVAITVWSRRDVMPAGDLDLGRLQEFIDVLYCRFDPEGFCN
jgi:hypothetical protein